MLTIGHVCNWCDKSLAGPSHKRYCNSACRQAAYRDSKKPRKREAKSPCVRCGDKHPEFRNQHGAYCEECMSTKAEQNSETEEARWDAQCTLTGCESNAGWDGKGRARIYCSNAHRAKAYRLRRTAEQAASLTA